MSAADMNAYMRNRRKNSPLQKFQDKKDSLKYRILKSVNYDTASTLIDEYGRACVELDAARKLYKTV